MQARRLGPLLKRALVSALTALEKAGVAVPDAILSGTGLGCMETTERVLDSLKTGEEGCSPTDFMQSTHNTIASTIAIRLGCSGYNCSYSQGDVSFENALLDAWLRQDWEALSVFTAYAPGEQSVFEDFEAAGVLLQYDLSHGSVAYDGQSAVLNADLTLRGDSREIEIQGYPLRLIREEGLWKMDYQALLAMMRTKE